MKFLLLCMLCQVAKCLFTVSRVDCLSARLLPVIILTLPRLEGLQCIRKLTNNTHSYWIKPLFPLLPLTFDVSLSFSEYTVRTRLVARFCLELQLCSSSRTKFGLSPNVWHAFSKVGFCWLTVGDAWLIGWLVVTPLLLVGNDAWLIGWPVVTLLVLAWLMGTWLIGWLVLVTTSELVMYGNTSCWTWPEAPNMSIPRTDIKSCISGVLWFLWFGVMSSTSGVTGSIDSELFTSPSPAVSNVSRGTVHVCGELKLQLESSELEELYGVGLRYR